MNSDDSPIIPPEVFQHGDYAEVTVVAEDRSQATVRRRKSASGLVRLHENGKITDDQFKAAMNITRVIEYISNDVRVKSALYSGRVDNSSGPLNDMSESISHVIDQVVYNKWRFRISNPKRMIIDMIIVDRPLAATARIYRLSWAKARMKLVDALDLWIEIREEAERMIDEDDIAVAVQRILTLENGKGN